MNCYVSTFMRVFIREKHGFIYLLPEFVFSIIHLCHILRGILNHNKTGYVSMWL